MPNLIEFCFSFPLEMHMVHINTKYANDSAKAMENLDGLAVVGIFFTNVNYEDFEGFDVRIHVTTNQTVRY